MTRSTALKFFLAGFTGIAGFASQGLSQPAAVLPQGTAIVDGIVEEEWDLVEDIFLEEDLLGSSPAAEDFSAYWKGFWDETNLYLLFVVEDSTPTTYNPIEIDMSNLEVFQIPVSFLHYIVENLDRITSNFWEYDVAQIYIDPDLSAGASFDGVDDTHVVFPRDGSMAEFMADPLGISSSVQVAATSSDNVWVLEMSIPLSDLGLAAEEGTQFGMDLVASDRGSEDSVQLVNQLGWGPGGNTILPEDFLVVELGEPAATRPEPGDVPDALLEDSILVSSDDQAIVYESEWFGVYSSPVDELNKNIVYNDFLGWLQFASISTPQISYIYSFTLADMLYTSSTLYPQYAYAYIMESWLFFNPSNDVANGSIWVYNYAASEWQQFSVESE